MSREPLNAASGVYRPALRYESFKRISASRSLMRPATPLVISINILRLKRVDDFERSPRVSSQSGAINLIWSQILCVFAVVILR
jgi:hypothetical protein